jgi:transposase-like protein
MERRKRRRFSAEFKAEAVRLVQDGRSINAVSKELDLASSVLSAWVTQAKTDAGKGRAGALTTAEKRELTELRRRVKQLEMEKEILKKAAAFFAKESG